MLPTKNKRSIIGNIHWSVDLYLDGTTEGFALPEQFQRYEKDTDGLPKTPYTKEDIQAYLNDCRQKCQRTIEALTDETAQRLCRFEWIEDGELTFLELLLYTMRHVQEHTAQLSLMLGQQKASSTLDWVGKARSSVASRS